MTVNFLMFLMKTTVTGSRIPSTLVGSRGHVINVVLNNRTIHALS